MLSISEAAVKARLYRARRRLLPAQHAAAASLSTCTHLSGGVGATSLLTSIDRHLAGGRDMREVTSHVYQSVISPLRLATNLLLERWAAEESRLRRRSETGLALLG
jgi:hypothetical protein